MYGNDKMEETQVNKWDLKNIKIFDLIKDVIDLLIHLLQGNQ